MTMSATVPNKPVIESGFSDPNNPHTIPSTYTKVASYNTVATEIPNNEQVGQSITAHYYAHASATQPAGTYTGAVKYTMVHPNTNIPNQPYNCTANKICYFPNAGNTVTDTMGDQSIASNDTSATLWASNFQRSGYGFAGWNTEYDGSGTFYGPNEDITFETGQYDGTGNHSAGLSLYAVWVEPAKDANGNELTFQTNNLLTTTLADGTTLNSKNNGYVTALRDKRDGQVYAVAKLADGNYWMIENLRLEAEYTRGSYYQSLAQGYGGVFAGLADSETANFSDSTVANSLYYSGTISGAATIDIGTNNYPGYRMPRYNNSNTANAQTDTNNYSANGNVYSYGNYYTWSAAMANTTYYGGSSSDAAGTSICPKGWRLPIGGRKASVGDSDFWKLSRAVIGADPANFAHDNFYYSGDPEGVNASKLLRNFPNNFLYSGDAGSGGIYDRKFGGYYWSSSAYGAHYAYDSSLDSSTLSPGTNGNVMSYGFAIRCVASST